MNMAIPLFGAALLFALGYLIGVKRYMWLIAGYRPGKIKDEETIAKSFRIWCFSGGILVIVLGLILNAR